MTRWITVNIKIPKNLTDAVKRAVSSESNTLGWKYKDYLEYFLHEGILAELHEFIRDEKK